jgi:hypothetical protein
MKSTAVGDDHELGSVLPFSEGEGRCPPTAFGGIGHVLVDEARSDVSRHHRKVEIVREPETTA